MIKLTIFLTAILISNIPLKASLFNDGQWRTTEYKEITEKAAHYTIDFGKLKKLKGFVYIPDAYKYQSRIAQYNISLSRDGRRWKTFIKNEKFHDPGKASYWPDKNEKLSRIFFEKTYNVRYLRLEALSTFSGSKTAAVAELQGIFANEAEPYEGQSMALLKGTRLAPSIHLSYKTSPTALSFYNEIKVTDSAPGSYFMVCGFSAGYFGIQELGNGKKVVIFSVWDKFDGDDPNLVPEDKKVKVIYQDSDVDVSRFGNEGTGGKSFFKYDWQVGKKYSFRVEMKPGQGRNEYTGYFYEREQKKWRKLVTFSTLSSAKTLRGFYCFVEDFKRNFHSFQEIRKAEFGNSYYQEQDGSWHPVKNYVFTKDSNPQLNINCVPKKRSAILVTGGETTNSDLKLYSSGEFNSSNKTLPKALENIND